MRIVAVFAALLGFAFAARAADVSIVLSESGPAYAEAAQAAELYLSSLAKTSRVAAEAFERGSGSASTVITLGTRAFHAVLASGHRAPIVAALIPRAAYELEL